MRLLGSISSVNSRQGIRTFKGEQAKLLHSDGVILYVPVFILDQSG